MPKPTPQNTPERSHISGRDFQAMVNGIGFDQEDVEDGYGFLENLGIILPENEIRTMMKNMAQDGMLGMDDQTPGLTTPSVGTPIQFLQQWLPGFVNIVTAPRLIDELVGISTVGAWEDEEVVWGILEPNGNARPYGDYTQTPRSSWNQNFARRTVVRFEDGIEVLRLESLRAARMRIASADEKRKGAGLSLNILRNYIGFYGYNDGDGRTYGFFNDPNLPAYVTVPNGAGGNPQWSTKTYLEIVADIRTAFAALRAKSNGLINPEKDQVTLALAVNAVDYLSVVSTYGNSVRQWLNETYPKTRIVTAPELDDGNGGVGVFYLYAETVDDGMSTDDARTFTQVVPAQFMLLGTAQYEKGYRESYSNATAGVLVKRPYAIVRYSGIST